MVLSKNHSQYTWKPNQQQHQNKHWPPNKISFSYPQCFNVSRVHPLVRALFPTNPIPEVLLARTLKFLYLNWAKLTQDLNILNIIQGFDIPFLENLVQGKSTNPPDLNQEQSKLVKEALKEMLLKSVIQPVSSCKNQYLSNLFLASKRDRPCNRLVINLKHLNNFIQHQYFKMEGLNLLQNVLQKGDYMCNLDLKNAYFCVPLKKESRKYVWLQWEGTLTLYEFLCLCFDLSLAPLIFTKILKVPISLLRRLQVRVIIYLDDMLLMSQTLEELLISRDKIIFLLTQLGLVINWKKSILVPVQQTEFLGLKIDSVEMKQFLPQRKTSRPKRSCHGGVPL